MSPSTLMRRLLARLERDRDRRQIARISSLPPGIPGVATVGDISFRYIDAPSFAWAYRTIFQEHIYRFAPSRGAPRIIDCGANIGLAVMYWKSLYPDCRITAFEPDGAAFSALQANCSGYEDVSLINAAVWVSEGSEVFLPDGADAGRLTEGDIAGSVTVRTVRLRDHLGGPIDLLKLDIEGAEVPVLKDCADVLGDVQHIFVEYHGFVDRDQELDDLLETIATAGLRWHIQVEFGSPTPFLETAIDRGMDQRLNIFASRPGSRRD